MYLAERIRQFRESMNLSQGDMEKRTGLFRCYISRVENGHTVPSIETLEKIALALEMPMYQFFYEGEEPPETPDASKSRNRNEDWASHRKGSNTLRRFRRALSRMTPADRNLLLCMARFASSRNRNK
jgi:transcriptional regulator with XRE-family HTH domain